MMINRKSRFRNPTCTIRSKDARSRWAAADAAPARWAAALAAKLTCVQLHALRVHDSGGP
eukprot:1157499-Pelagomonas_calceolata.AAC.2